jgi:hypothetical protein
MSALSSFLIRLRADKIVGSPNPAQFDPSPRIHVPAVIGLDNVLMLLDSTLNGRGRWLYDCAIVVRKRIV